MKQKIILLIITALTHTTPRLHPVALPRVQTLPLSFIEIISGVAYFLTTATLTEKNSAACPNKKALLENIPEEIITNFISSYLDKKSMLNLRVACKKSFDQYTMPFKVKFPIETAIFPYDKITPTIIKIKKDKLYSLSLEQFQAFIQALENLISPTTLDISHNSLNSLSPEKFTALAQALGKLTKLATLNLSGNFLSCLNQNQLEMLTTALESLTNLTSLNLSGSPLGYWNQPSPEILVQFTKAIIKTTTLKTLDISNNNLSNQQINQIQQTNPNLKIIN